MPPCFTPLDTQKDAEKVFPHRICILWREYNTHPCSTCTKLFYTAHLDVRFLSTTIFYMNCLIIMLISVQKNTRSVR